jgi:hypothetical protein
MIFYFFHPATDASDLAVKTAPEGGATKPA